MSISWNLDSIIPPSSILLCHGYLRINFNNQQIPQSVSKSCIDYYEAKTISNIIKNTSSGLTIYSPIYVIGDFSLVNLPKSQRCKLHLSLLSLLKTIQTVKVNLYITDNNYFHIKIIQ